MLHSAGRRNTLLSCCLLLSFGCRCEVRHNIGPVARVQSFAQPIPVREVQGEMLAWKPVVHVVMLHSVEANVVVVDSTKGCKDGIGHMG